MKKIISAIALLSSFFLLPGTSAAFAQPAPASNLAAAASSDADESAPPAYYQEQRIPTYQELLDSQRHMGVMFNWGAAWGNVTRIKKQSGRSNFVWNDSLLGLFFEVQSHDMLQPYKYAGINFVGRTAVYYPYRYTFNKHPQSPKQTLLYAFDFFTGPQVNFSIMDAVRVNFAPGVHWSYQLSDKWHYWSLGPGVKIDTELPVSSRWTILMGGMFSWDNANLGTNARMQPLDFAWEYQAQFGARYSYNCRNPFSYIKYKEPKGLRAKEKLIMKVWPSEKARIKAERKARAEQRKTNRRMRSAK